MLSRISNGSETRGYLEKVSMHWEDVIGLSISGFF
jgi:hypothetical protein